MSYKTISTYVDVDVELDDFDDDELIEILKGKGYTVNKTSEYNNVDDVILTINKLYHLRRTGRDYNQVLDHLIYTAIGKIV